MKKTFKLLMAALLVCITASAQWNTDISKNNLISPNEQMCYDFEVGTNDNGITYAFMELPMNGKIVQKLQMFDKDGYKYFDDACKTISAEESFSSTVFGQRLFIDDQGDALAIVNDLRSGEYGYTLYKFDEKGSEIWGNVQLNDGKPLHIGYNAKVCQTSDGGYVIAYIFNEKNIKYEDAYIQIEKVDRDGKIAWVPIKIGDGEYDDTCSEPYVFDVGSGRCMVVFAEGADMVLKGRMLDADGKAVWDKDLIIYDYGCWGSMPLRIMMNAYEGPDKGVIVAWQDLRDGNVYRNSISYITKDGEYAFPTGSEGTSLSNDMDYSRRYPSVFYDDKEKAFFCFYRQYDQVYQTYCGLFMQKISYSGERLWGDNGKAVIDIQKEDNYDYYNIKNIDDDRFAVFYQKAMGNTALSTIYSYMIIYDKNGNQLTEPINFSTSETPKSSLQVSDIIDGRYFLANWNEDRRTKEPGDKTPAQAAYIQRIDCESVLTAIDNVSDSDNRKVVRVDVFSIDGKKIDSVVKGVNLIRNTHDDGTVETKKIMK